MAAFLLLPLQLIFLATLIILSASLARARSTNSTGTDFSCFVDSVPSCQTFVTYRAWSPDYLDLESIAGLFGVNTSSIAAVNQYMSEQRLLVPDELLLIPIRCDCNESRYFYPVSYQIKKDNSFYSVSVREFENLTNFQFVEDMNPQLKPLNLTIGAEAVFPLLCKCPSRANITNRFRYLITYIWQPGDDVFSLSAMFNSEPFAILEANNYRNFSAAVNLPVIIPVQVAALSLVPAPASKSKSNIRRILIIVLSIAMFLFVLLVASLAYMHLVVIKNKVDMVRNFSSIEFALLPKMTKGSGKHLLPKMTKGSGKRLLDHKTNQDKLLRGVSGHLGRLRVYDINVIMEATEGLSQRSRIGGSVYKARIEERTFAVKKVRDVSEELRILQRVNHGNLMQLMGVSSDKEKGVFLVLEYAEYGSLDKWLFPKASSSSRSAVSLTWTQRLDVAIDVANGLQYLHEHAQPKIVHRDVRASNILLDSRFKAQIGNFSLAKEAESSLVLKVDVFAFGVVLLELLSGKKSMETLKSGEVVMMWKDIRRILDDEEKKEERFRRWMDPRLKNSYPLDNALSLASLARVCTSDRSSDRPKMADVVFSLCVIAQSSVELCERSWCSMDLGERSWYSGEADETSPVITPVIAR